MCSKPLFIPNFEPLKIHYFHSHFLASRGPEYFVFLISQVEKKTLQPLKEKHKQLYKVKSENNPLHGPFQTMGNRLASKKASINDDLEDFITRLSQSKEIGKKIVNCFLTPKLTKEELKLVELKDEAHLLSYHNYIEGEDPDVDPEEMKKSDSKDKFVYTSCCRITECLTLGPSSNLSEIQKEEISYSEMLAD